MFDAMDAPEASNRQALMFVRLVAGCLILVGLLDTSLYVAHCFRVKKPESQEAAPTMQFEQSAPVEALPIVLNSLPCLAGVVILIKSKAVADWVAEKLE